MMTCRNVQHVLHQFLDGDLSPGLMAEVHAHLLQCPACQREVEITRAGGEVIAKDRSEPSLQPGFASRVVATMMQQEPARFSPAARSSSKPRRHWKRYAAAGGLPAMAAAVLLFIALWPSERPEDRPKLVAGVSVVDATGVKDLMDPTMDAMSGARDAVRSLNQVLRLSADEAGQTMRDSLGALGRPDDAQTPPTILEIFFQPFDLMLEPAIGNTTDEDSDLVRF